MSNYQIFIDETGQFSGSTLAKSYVGGWVCREPVGTWLPGMLAGVAGRFNSLLENEGESPTFVCPEQLHFFPLHFPANRTGEDRGIKVNPAFAPRLTTHLCACLFA